jgi:N-methylhydantoinase A/oxoprolinase/acetone carboxylase beta subunit
MKYIIGIDVGGTNTDIVLIDENKKIIFKDKKLTTKPIFKGIIDFLEDILKIYNSEDIFYISIGSTFAINSLLEGKNLSKVGVIRIIESQSEYNIPPCFNWPKNIKEKTLASFVNLKGGFECSGEESFELSEKEIENKVNKLIENGAESIALVGSFSPIYKEQEIRVKNYINNKFNISITISNDIGGFGFLERENATIVNSTLIYSFKKEFESILEYAKLKKINFYIVQNDGTLSEFESAINFPIKTISAGVTNSCIGGAKLANLKDAIIVDIGGTSTDFCFIKNGFPKKSTKSISIGGINLEYSAPDIISIGLGGGSIIKKNNADFTIGPESVAKDILIRAYAFGGSEKTLTDAAISLNKINIWNNKLKFFIKEDAKKILNTAFSKIVKIINNLKQNSTEKIDVIFVGGGAIIFKSEIENNGYIIPEFFDIANAYGAAYAEVCSKIDKIIELKNDLEIINIENQIIENAIKNGAKNPRIIEKTILPFHYIPGNKARIIIIASGERI